MLGNKKSQLAEVQWAGTQPGAALQNAATDPFGIPGPASPLGEVSSFPNMASRGPGWLVAGWGGGAIFLGLRGTRQLTGDKLFQVLSKSLLL